MGQYAKLKKAKLGYIASESEMPRWGQLGCNGFILLDAQHQIACPQSAAYLQVREGAFRDLEARLQAVLAGQSYKGAELVGQGNGEGS